MMMQVRHLSRCLRDVQACSLRFTVYTRDEHGAIVELLNTGMVDLGRFLQSDEEEDRTSLPVEEMVLDFEDDVSDPFSPC